jgi:hypothetical protein
MPESVVAVGFAEFDASALKRRTKLSPPNDAVEIGNYANGTGGMVPRGHLRDEEGRGAFGPADD